jgi:UDP-N-acetylmuramate dehydrogenase
MGLDVNAEYYVAVTNSVELLEAIDFARTNTLSVFVLGGGSNIVLLQNVSGLCLHIAIKGFEQEGRLVHVGAGMNWHQLVLSTLEAGLFGLENLSLIPGQAGAAPIQNIGAYGVELSERLVTVSYVDLQTGASHELDASGCEFGYRDSVFKHALKDQAIITSISLALDDNFKPRLGYAGIEDYLADRGDPITAMAVSKAVCAIRRHKLPDPGRVGNAGSFFKNPVVSDQLLQRLKSKDGNIPAYAEAAGHFKLSAAYLIEQAGLKGLQVGNAMGSDRHALVIQNNGNATGSDVRQLAREVQNRIKARFDIELEIEPRLIPD